MLKRIFDFCLSLFLCVFLLPVFIIVGILVRLKLGSPVFFKQKRPGKAEKIFTIYKFRTMTDERDGNGVLESDKKRLTRFGQFLRSTSLDELPQLLNVLKGDMSFVGPRALLVEYLPLYSDTQKRRHQVKPGITGWAQVNGRNTITWEQKFAYDVWYVQNRSFILDFKILYLTFKKVIRREGISQNASTTMEEFLGNKNNKKI